MGFFSEIHHNLHHFFQSACNIGILLDGIIVFLFWRIILNQDPVQNCIYNYREKEEARHKGTTWNTILSEFLHDIWPLWTVVAYLPFGVKNSFIHIPCCILTKTNVINAKSNAYKCIKIWNGSFPLKLHCSDSSITCFKRKHKYSCSKWLKEKKNYSLEISFN